ncbi:hypothetical protein PSN13_06504 [Micromonospora saelicesensis]|uniref:Uncharacterized protein n=1 Tax=Micromonospora saelicesensis TaxID=285676 RepID=A0A328NC27_9ACTN|nr:hypothetical protein [Micromonospora saelicesensis]RAO26476.1 hypothetical protein PSN13_06504 [Micromonospora saelicesensis]
MTRRRFPDSADRLGYQLGPDNRFWTGAGLPAVAYDALTGPELADLASDPDGEPIADATLTVDATSGLPDFLGPDDGRDVVYVSVNGGPRYPVKAKTEDRVAELAADLGSALDGAAADATAKASAAQAAAIAASVPRAYGKNLFDFTTAYGPGKFWNGASGTPIDLAGWYASRPIPVTVGQAYSLTNARNYLWLTAGMVPVGAYGNNPTEAPVTATAPANAAFLAFNVATAKLTTAQVEAGSAASAFEPFGVVVDRQVAAGRYLADAAANVTALQRMPGVAVYRSGNTLLVRSAFDSTRDILMPIHLAHGAEAQVNLTNDAAPLVRLVASSASDDLVWPTPSTGTAIHDASDDSAPINAQWAYIGGNHGWTAGWTVTAAGHGKATADLGSQWSDGTRTYTLLAVLSASQLLVGGPYSVSSGVVTGSVGAPAATLTHVSGATNTASLPITGGVANTQIHPSSYAHSVTVALDGRPLPDGKAAGQVLTISESYLIASYKGLVDWAQANIGTPVLSNLAAVPALARISNTYRVTAAQVVVAQRVTAAEKFVINMGVTQAFPLVLPSGGSRRQFMPGVGTVNGVDWRTFADLTAVSTQADIGSAGWLSPLVPPASMTQWAYDSTGAAQYGLAMGLLPTGDGHPSQRLKNAAGKGWFIASSTKKNYPQLAWAKTLNVGESLSGTAYRRYLAPPFGPTELVVSDGADTWAIIERTDTAADARMPAPELLGRRLVPVGPATVNAAARVTGDGVAYSVPSAPGFGVWQASADAPRVETIPGSTGQAGSYFLAQQGPAITQALIGGNFQVLYLWPIYLPEATPVDRACIEVTTAGTGVLRHGVYGNDPATGQPTATAPLADFGTVDVTTIGVKESTLSPAVMLPAGWHWYGQVWQGTNTTPPAIRATNASASAGPLNIGSASSAMSAARYCHFTSGVTGALGALTLGALQQLVPPRLAYRRA